MLREQIGRYWQEITVVANSVPIEDVAHAAQILADCHERAGKVIVIGNGGSAATAAHFATDLAKGTRTEGFRPFRVLSLADNAALMTALGNDLGYDRVFAEQVTAVADRRDVLVIISASGNSLNVLAAADAAREMGTTVVAMTGQTGGRLRRLADHTIRVPARPIEQVEDAHLIIAHSICVALRERFEVLSREAVPGKRARGGAQLPLATTIDGALDRIGLES